MARAAAVLRHERGQASVELVAGLPLLLLAAGVALQLLIVGYSVTLADGAAEAGSLAAVAGEPVREAARRALPGWARDAVSIRKAGGRVTVSLQPPSPIGALREGLAVSSTAVIRTETK